MPIFRILSLGSETPSLESETQIRLVFLGLNLLHSEFYGCKVCQEFYLRLRKMKYHIISLVFALVIFHTYRPEQRISPFLFLFHKNINLKVLNCSEQLSAHTVSTAM